MRLWVGSVGSGADGSGEGIYAVEHDAASGSSQADLAATLQCPSYLATHPVLPIVYAVNEVGPGSVTSLCGDGNGTLWTSSSVATDGEGACFVAVHPSGRLLVVANYLSGSVSVHPVGSDGCVEARSSLIEYSGVGPIADRQSGSHPHCARFAPDGAVCAVADLGTDTVSVHHVDLERCRLGPSVEGGARAASGSGPRHLAFTSPQLIHVACELDSTVTTFRLSGRTGMLDRLARVCAATPSIGTKNFPSEIVSTADGRFVYVANRGADLIRAFAVFGEELRLVAETPAGGRWPRHLVLQGWDLYVANQRSDEIVHMRIDPRTGCLSPSGARTRVPSPTCLAVSAAGATQ